MKKMEKQFVVIGMPRGGTTYLYHNLQRHPKIYMPFRKEVNYFNANYDRGENWYLKLYEDAEDDQICADISPPCFMMPESDKRILDFNPDCKIILSVRSPLEWALSFYAQFSSFNFDMMPFKDFIEGYNYKVGKNTLRVTFQENYIPNRIEQLKERFGDNLLIYRQEVLKTDALDLFHVLEDFLELPSYFTKENIDDRRINASDRKNIVWLQRFLANEQVISVIEKYIPRKFVLSARQKFDAGSVNKKAKNVQQIYSEEDVKLACKVFEDQQAYVDNLFSESNFLLGDGTIIKMQDCRSKTS